MKLEVTKEVAIDVAQLLIREQAMYTTDESIVPERIKNIRSFIDEIADKVKEECWIHSTSYGNSSLWLQLIV